MLIKHASKLFLTHILAVSPDRFFRQKCSGDPSPCISPDCAAVAAPAALARWIGASGRQVPLHKSPSYFGRDSCMYMYLYASQSERPLIFREPFAWSDVRAPTSHLKQAPLSSLRIGRRRPRISGRRPKIAGRHAHLDLWLLPPHLIVNRSEHLV